ncbi:MAG: LysM peptidoglycan-binding domain-containing protein [Ferrimicrobium sp.]
MFEITKPKVAVQVVLRYVLVGAIAALALLVVVTRLDAAQSFPTSRKIYVVRPGDTLVGIASRFDGGGNLYSLVFTLTQEVGGAIIYPGEQLVIPASGAGRTS